MSRRVTVFATVLLIAAVGVSGLAAADVHQLEIETAYDGGNENADQAIEVSVTITPDGSDISDVEIVIRDQDAVVDGASYSESVDPGVNLERRNDGYYVIDELESDQEVTIEFVAYPRDIKSEEIEAVAVDTQFFDGAQSSREVVTVDVSDSPWFQLQHERENAAALSDRVDELEGELQRRGLVDRALTGVFWGGVVFGLIGIGAAGVLYKKKGSELEELRGEHLELIDRLEKQIDGAQNRRHVQQVRSEIDDDDNDW